MSLEIENLCVNCQNQLVGQYCHHCGQKGEVGRVTWKWLINELISKWFGLDNKLSHTVKGLTIEPGKTVRSYLDGNRVKLIGPMGYFFLMTLIFIVIYDLLDINMLDLFEESSGLVAQDLTEDELQAQRALQLQINQFLTNYYRYILIAGIPFLSLCSMVFYRKAKRKFNLLENIVFFLYVLSHSLWFSVFLDGLLIYFQQNLLLISPSLSMLYYVYALYTFQEKKGFPGIINSILTIVLGYLIFSILGGILVAFFLK